MICLFYLDFFHKYHQNVMSRTCQAPRTLELYVCSSWGANLYVLDSADPCTVHSAHLTSYCLKQKICEQSIALRELVCSNLIFRSCTEPRRPLPRDALISTPPYISPFDPRQLTSPLHHPRITRF